MLKVLRYALATLCFAASIGWLALWWHTVANERHIIASYGGTSMSIQVRVVDGTGIATLRRLSLGTSVRRGWQFNSTTFRGRASQTNWTGLQQSLFGHTRSSFFFPLWYPALIFAVTGVAALKLGHRFTLRSAIIATTIVAGLLGMAVRQ